MIQWCWLLSISLAAFSPLAAQTNYGPVTEGDYQSAHFAFESGDTLDSLRMHYYTLGTPIADSQGNTLNAVLILHGTLSASPGFLGPQFGGYLFGQGQLLDARKYFIIFADGIGHGKSSRPSDGMHMHFPPYTYNDMVKAQYQLLTQRLKVNHLRLILGTSMGGMHAWVWGYTYPHFMDALLPLACQPAAIAGRNRMMRKMAIDLIKLDPAWQGGEYRSQPTLGLTGALSSFFFMNSSALQLQKAAPTRADADALVASNRIASLLGLDANDAIYALESSRFYDPSPFLGLIKAPVFAINSADDEINPPELPLMEAALKEVAKGRYILLPITERTVGHGTNSLPAVWGTYLKELLEISRKPD